jgi:hypothetical protein
VEICYVDAEAAELLGELAAYAGATLDAFRAAAA